MLYTFEGNVNQVYNVSDINVGDEVSYTFFADTDLQGTHTAYNGYEFTYPDFPNYDIFYDEYVSGSILPDSGYYNDSNCRCVASYNYGYLYDDGNLNQLRFVGGSSNSWIEAWTNGTTQITLGDSYYGYNVAYDVNGSGGYVYSNLTLSSISDVSQVPEPASLLLLGSGLLGMVVLGKRLGWKTKTE